MNDNQQLLDVLTREGVLVAVNVRYWRARKKLDAQDVGLDPDDVRRGLFTSSRAESRVRDAAMARAQGLIEVAAGSKENIGRARSNAEKTLRLLFKRLGWDVEIAWQGAGRSR